MIEARTVQYSSIICLVHPFSSLLSKGVDELMDNCRVAGTAKDKLRRVIVWVQRSRSTLCNELKGGRLYVWDSSDYIPLLVRNKAAEILFGNISAEKVHQSYKAHKADNFRSRPSMDAAKAHKPNETGNEVMNIALTSTRATGSGISEKKHGLESPDFCAIWLILLKML
ncbi:hypothetical protein KSS87_013127, partial [Heliosperma pusillum]